MEKIVGLKELRINMNEYIAEIKKGKTFIVVRRSKPVFKICPPYVKFEKHKKKIYIY